MTNKKIITGSYEPMPEIMFFELKKEKVRGQLAQQESSLLNCIKKIREKGFDFTSVDEVKGFTSDFVRAQIADAKKKRLQDSKFLPMAIKRREESEFRELEKELVPLADSVQSQLASIPCEIHIGKDGKVFLDASDIDKYIKEQCTMQIPEDIRLYYDEVQKVCEAWNNLCTWTNEHGFIAPTTEIIENLVGESNNGICKFSLSHDQMFNMYLYGVIRKSAVNVDNLDSSEKPEIT